MHRTSKPLWALAAIPLLLGMIPAGDARAGVYTDDLSKCLVKATDTNDRVELVQWIFSALALHPAVQPFASFTAEQRASISKKGAALFVRLLAENCRKESVEALKYEGAPALGAGFQVLGQVASRDLMTDPHVAAGMNELVGGLDNDPKLKALLKDAGK